MTTVMYIQFDFSTQGYFNEDNIMYILHNKVAQFLHKKEFYLCPSYVNLSFISHVTERQDVEYVES